MGTSQLKLQKSIPTIFYIWCRLV